MVQVLMLQVHLICISASIVILLIKMCMFLEVLNGKILSCSRCASICLFFMYDSCSSISLDFLACFGHNLVFELCFGLVLLHRLCKIKLTSSLFDIL